jgi:hypothetical protein
MASSRASIRAIAVPRTRSMLAIGRVYPADLHRHLCEGLLASTTAIQARPWPPALRH